MRTNAASSVKDGRYYLQLAGAEARERLLLAAAALWKVPVAELRAKNSIITHASSGRTTTYGQIAHRAAAMPHPHPETITIKPPDQWTLMGTEQKNLDVPAKVTGKTVYAIDVRVPGMKWAAVKACPVYGGDVKSYDFERHSHAARRALGRAVPDTGSHAVPAAASSAAASRSSPTRGIRPRRRSTRCRSSGTSLPTLPR